MALTIEIVKEGDPAPGFTLPTLKGERISLNDLVGKNLREPKKSVILGFFATYCKPCIKDINYLEGLKEKYGNKGLKILLIDSEKIKEKRIEKFFKKNSLDVNAFPILLDRYKIVSRRYNVVGLPKLVVIDSKGNVVKIILGFSEKIKEEFEKKIRGLIYK